MSWDAEYAEIYDEWSAHMTEDVPLCAHPARRHLSRLRRVRRIRIPFTWAH